MNIWYSRILRQFARDFGISYTTPFREIPKKVQQILMYGTEAKGDNGTGTEFEGIIPNLQRRFETTERRVGQSAPAPVHERSALSDVPRDAIAAVGAGGAIADRLTRHRANTGSDSCRISI